MKNWMKTLLCTVAAATLVACGGSDDAAPAAATTSSNVTVATLAGLSAGMESAAGLAIDGVDAGFYGNFATLAAPTGLESPATMVFTQPTCTNAGTVSFASDILTYSNCKIGDATLDGKAKIVSSGGSTPSYTITFDTDTANPLKITGEGSDGKTATFTYSGTQVVTNLQGEYPDYTGAKITLNATVKIGTSSTVKFTNFIVDYGRIGGNIERTTVNGKYAATIKLADFGMPATPGVPETLDVTFDVTTPTAVDYNYVTDKDVAGIIKFSYTGVFVIEVDYGVHKVRFTPTGGATQEFSM